MISRDPVGPIQVLPPGLTNLLQLKVGGYSPDALRQDVQPTIDLEQWWLRATKQNLPATWSVALAAGAYDSVLPLANAAGALLEVPAREWWYIHRCTILVDVAVATVTNGLSFAIAEPGGARGIASNLSEFTLGTFYLSAAIGQRYLLTQSDVWLPPGTRIGVFLGTVGVGGTATAILSGLSYTRLQL